ncbi:glycosyl hydrolase family 28-related protein [Butyrivibrio sp. VCB2001]|uniref:glycosyl hydrolase family 28-related protein n=1 Tax=Butyrivibrio sp. VCB2001 TaxID=1280667 RepID=UPI0003FCD315|nr:glycosyl hydrolase family 28-related protein [Butyrivibrio sp. VCB2001]
MFKKKYLVLLGLVAFTGLFVGCGKNNMEIKDYHTDILGENVYIFTPEDEQTKIQETLDRIYSVQETAQFEDNRYAVYFMPGTYNVSADVGFYTQLSGLGVLPTDTKIAAANTYARWLSNPQNLHNATCNFWRSIENIEMQSDTVWAVSQATDMRRVQVDGNLTLHDDYGWASGGFLADSKVTGLVDSGTQQQWLSRNNSYSSWTGQNWNIVMLGDAPLGVPDKTWPEASYTAVSQTPIIREKPFLVYDEKDGLGVFVPEWKEESMSFAWEGDAPEGKVLPLNDFYVAKENVDSAKSINEALTDGKNVLFTPGIYELDEALKVQKSGTILLGMGLATLRSAAGNECVVSENADDLILAGLLFDAGTAESENLVCLGAKEGAKPSLIADVYFRVGGIASDEPCKTKACITIDLDNVVGDNLWVWRADHGDNVGWDLNTCENGIIINGDHVTMYALMVEHFNGYQTMWNGNAGTCIMYQSEVPYDVPDRGQWINPDGKRFGYASFKVAEDVSSFNAAGLGIYLYNRDNTIPMYCAMEVPDVEGVHVHNAITAYLNGFPGMKCVINEAGDSLLSAGQTAKVLDYENGQWR